VKAFCIAALEDSGGQRGVSHCSLLCTAKLNGLDLAFYLRTVLARSPNIRLTASRSCCRGASPPQSSSGASGDFQIDGDNLDSRGKRHRKWNPQVSLTKLVSVLGATLFSVSGLLCLFASRLPNPRIGHSMHSKTSFDKARELRSATAAHSVRE